MKIKTAEFIVSNTDYKLCPKETLAEYAFIGRSNVGKSSLFNALVKKNLALVDNTPRYTRDIKKKKLYYPTMTSL